MLEVHNEAQASYRTFMKLCTIQHNVHAPVDLITHHPIIHAGCNPLDKVGMRMEEKIITPPIEVPSLGLRNLHPCLQIFTFEHHSL